MYSNGHENLDRTSLFFNDPNCTHSAVSRFPKILFHDAEQSATQPRMCDNNEKGKIFLTDKRLHN